MIELDVYRTDGSTGTVSRGFGVDLEGHPVTFAGDPRALRDIQEAIDAGERPLRTMIEEWAVIWTDRDLVILATEPSLDDRQRGAWLRKIIAL